MEIKTVGECFYQIRNGANIKQGIFGGGYPITRIETIANDKFNRDRMGYAGITDLEKYQSYVLEDGDLLMSHINSVQYLGRTVLYEKQDDEQIIHGMNLLSLKADKSIILPSYARYFFYTRSFREQLGAITKKSVNQASFSVADLKKIRILVPSIDEQKSIAKVLDTIINVIALRQQELQKLDELVKARFVEMFGDPELNPQGLPVLPWNAVFLTTTGKLDSNAMVENGRYPFFTCAKESYKIDSYAFDCEALLLAGNNAAGIYDVKHYKGKFNAYQRTYVLRLMNEKWSYILFKRQLEDKLQYLQSQSKGTNTRYLTLGILNELRFVVPPVAEQEQFAVFVEQTDKSKLAIQQSLNKLKTLRKSLMQEYYGQGE